MTEKIDRHRTEFKKLLSCNSCCILVFLDCSLRTFRSIQIFLLNSNFIQGLNEKFCPLRRFQWNFQISQYEYIQAFISNTY